MIEVLVCCDVNYDPDHWPVVERWEIDANEHENTNVSQAWLARQNGWC